MKRYYKIILFLLCDLVALTACSQQASSSPVMDYKLLVKKLQAAGTPVAYAGNVSQSFMNAQGQLITIHGEQVEVYEYATADDADKQASTISSDGSTFTTKSLFGLNTSATTVDWVKPPHFYKQGRLIVLYVGTNNAIMQLLSHVLSKQFAGA